MNEGNHWVERIIFAAVMAILALVAHGGIR